MKQTVLLSLVFLAFCTFIISAISEESTTFVCGDYKYSLTEDGYAMITSYLGSESEIAIPMELDGYPVIGISDKAFHLCFFLKSTSIPDSVTNIGVNPWLECNKMTEITVSSNHPTMFVVDGVLYNKVDKSLIYCPALREDLSLDIPHGIVKVGDYACAYSNITEIVIPDSVESIGDYAFLGCYRLTEISIPNSVIKIGTNPWGECYKLSSIKISPRHTTLAIIDGVLYSKIDKRLVFYPTTITDSSFEIPQGIRIIDDYAFYSVFNPRSITSRLTRIIIPNSVERISSHAFYNCFNLSEIIIPESVTFIDEYAFSGCNSLKTITLTDTISAIASGTFLNCSHLEVVTLPNSMTKIGDYAFCWCRKLTELKLPEDLVQIGDYAFRGCEVLNNLIIPNTVTSIGIDAFDQCSDLTIILTKDSYAEQYCIDNNLPYQYTNPFDWLG